MVALGFGSDPGWTGGVGKAGVTKQTWTATVAAVLFVVLAGVIALAPVPYVIWSPGAAYDLLADGSDPSPIEIDGATTYETTGQMLMTTLSVTAPDATLSLPEMVFSYWLTSREVLPREVVYRDNQSTADYNSVESELMTDSQSDAVVAALRQSGIPVESWPKVASVTPSGPANDILQPGDLIKAVGQKSTRTAAEVEAEIARNHVGEPVTFTVQRGDEELLRTVTTRATTANPDQPVVGTQFADWGYTYKPKVSFNLDAGLGGSSAGLMFALAVTDKLTPIQLADRRTIAGSGTMAADGTVGPIGGVQEKIAAAARAGATVFVLPRSNCVDAVDLTEGVRLVPVDSLEEAISALTELSANPDSTAIAGCK